MPNLTSIREITKLHKTSLLQAITEKYELIHVQHKVHFKTAITKKNACILHQHREIKEHMNNII